MSIPTLSKRAAKRLARDPGAAWTTTSSGFEHLTDTDAFAYLAADQAARDYVRQVELWSSWCTDADDVNARSREHVADARHWEDVQCARAAEPVGYWLTSADGSRTWVEPEAPTSRTEAATEAAAIARQKGPEPMTPAERKSLSRWRKRTAGQWTCTEHPDPALTDCGPACREAHVAEREQAARAALPNVNVHAH